jgi:c-di-GMP-binding flagellar brake protein YcgR
VGEEFMLSKYVQVGSKLEIQAVERGQDYELADKRTVYQSQVYEIVSEDRLEIIMPMEKTKLIMLPVDAEYDLYFYTENGLYQCFARVVDRYKDNYVYLLLIELTSNLRKYQRREYYRFSCALEMNSRPLEKEEIDSYEQKSLDLSPGLPLQRSVVVDISGGGLRFLANYSYELEMMIACRYHLVIEGKNKEYNLLGKVLEVREVDNRPGVYEHRVQYVDINTDEREEIIKFIFEEERKTRKRERGF